MENQKTLFITCLHSLISKNILNTEAFKKIVNEANCKIVIFVPKGKYDFFSQHYIFPNVVIEEVDTYPIMNIRREVIFKRIAFLLINSHYHWYKRAELLDKNKNIGSYFKYFFEQLFVRIFSGHKAINSIYRRMHEKYAPKGSMDAYFEKYNPTLLFATDVFDDMDTIVIREAKRKGIKVVGMVRSWDNCFSKGLMRNMPDSLLVNNENLKSEAVEMHDFPGEKIEIVGLPQFDHFINEKRLSKDDFFKKIGADPEKKLILFAPAGAFLSDCDLDYLKIFEQATQARKFKYPLQFLVRNHPHHPAILDDFAGKADFIIDTPGKQLK